jgi:hypothetical protein
MNPFLLGRFERTAGSTESPGHAYRPGFHFSSSLVFLVNGVTILMRHAPFFRPAFRFSRPRRVLKIARIRRYRRVLPCSLPVECRPLMWL